MALLIIGGAVAAYLLTRPKKVIVPTVVNEQIKDASAVLENAGLTVGGPLYVQSGQPSGTVIRESPPGGTKVNDGSRINLTVSSGPGTAVLPGVYGDQLTQAKSTIRAAHLAIGNIRHQTSSLYSAGEVISTDPPAGATLPVGTKVDLFVSSGPPKVTVPDVTTDTAGQAKATLSAAGFLVKVDHQTSSTAPAGTVINQSPAGGTYVLPNSTVTIVVAKAPSTTTVPDVHGQPAATATSALRQAGFKVTQQLKNVSDQGQDGIVLSESPHHGSTAKKGSTVTITVGHYVAPTTTTPTTTTPTTTTSTSGP